jgi:hypothetical protein
MPGGLPLCLKSCFFGTLNPVKDRTQLHYGHLRQFASATRPRAHPALPKRLHRHPLCSASLCHHHRRPHCLWYVNLSRLVHQIYIVSVKGLLLTTKSSFY